MDTHDQSASRISGRTRGAVSAMCVRALRITVLKSAGNFTRDEYHDLNAEKIQRVKSFMHEVRNLLRAILQLGDDPKFVAVDDAEVVGDSIAEVVPVLGNRVFQEFQNRSLELPEGFVVPVMGRVLVHESPTLFDRIEMGTIWRDEVQHGFSVVLF